MTTSHELAAMTDEQFNHHLLQQAVEGRIADMRDDAAFLDGIRMGSAAQVLRRHADALNESLNHTDGIQR